MDIADDNQPLDMAAPLRAHGRDKPIRQVRDEVLRQVAAMLRDVCHDETVSRIGGDEFTIIQTGKDQPTAAKMLVGRLMKAMGDYRLAHSVSVSISIGAAIYPRDGDSDQALRHHADLALYRAKHDGRGRACFFGALEAVAPEGHGTGASSLALDLPAAIRTGELAVAYQPKLHARTNLVTSALGLSRRRAEELRAAGLDHVQVSIQADEPAMPQDSSIQFGRP